MQNVEFANKARELIAWGVDEFICWHAFEKGALIPQNIAKRSIRHDLVCCRESSLCCTSL